MQYHAGDVDHQLLYSESWSSVPLQTSIQEMCVLTAVTGTYNIFMDHLHMALISIPAKACYTVIHVL